MRIKSSSFLHFRPSRLLCIHLNINFAEVREKKEKPREIHWRKKNYEMKWRKKFFAIFVLIIEERERERDREREKRRERKKKGREREKETERKKKERKRERERKPSRVISQAHKFS